MPSKAFSVDLQAITQRRQVDQHIEQISQRVGAAGSLALGFSLHQPQTLAASASDVAVVVQAIHDDIRAMRLAESDATAFPAASVHFIQRDIALLHRTKLSAVLLRLAHDEQVRAADLSQVVQANSGGTLIFAASSSLADGVILLDAYLARSSAPFHPSSGRSRRHEHRARSSTQDPVRRVWLYSGVSYVRLGRV